jgi:Dolichyl-phosphate-mannose-protein mannosyltransferase
VTSRDRAIRTLHVGAIAALLVAGILVRSWGVLIAPLDLWADEAWWATVLESSSLVDFGFRPIGYMWICRQLLDFGSAEVMLRLPSWLAGIAALIFIYKTAALTFRSRVAVVFVLVLAVAHPYLVVFAKEFKPYSVEVFVYSALTFWALFCLRRGRASAGFLAACVIAIPFCYPVVFMYPGIALAFAGKRLAGLRRFPLRYRVVAVLMAVPLLLLLHIYLFESLQAAQSRWFWGTKYDVFPIDTGLAGGLVWYARKTWSLMTLPGALERMPGFAQQLFGVAYVGGIVALLAAKRLSEFAVLSVPMVTALFANLLGYWPYGAFRTNLFLVPGALLVIGHGIDWLAARSGTRHATYALLAGLLVVAASVNAESYRTKLSRYWAGAPQLTQVLDEIERRRSHQTGIEANVILADWHSWRPIDYYLREYPGLQEQSRLVRGALGDAAVLEAQIAKEVDRAREEGRATRLWIVITRLEPHRAVLSSELIGRFAVDQREFQSQDRDYHPILIELRI